MVKKKYNEQDVWKMSVKNVVDLLNELVEKNEKLEKYKNDHILDMLNYPLYDYYYPFPIVDVRYNNFYYRTSRQLKNFLKENGFLIDNVSRSSVGNLKFYHIEINLCNEVWEYEKTNDLIIGKLLKIKNIGLVDFHKRNGMIHEVILIDENELNEKYLKNGNLIFDNE